MNLFIVLAIFAVVAFGYLAYHRGFKEAAGVTAVFFAALYAAFSGFFGAFH